MFILYIVLLVVYLGFGFLTAPDLPRLWSWGRGPSSLEFQMNVIIVLVVVLYSWGAIKILSKILRLRGVEKNPMIQSNYKTAGILALLLVFSSFLWERNSLGGILTAIVVVPYLLIMLRNLMLEKAQYKQSITVAIYLLVLLTVLGPILIFSGYYKGVFLVLTAKGLGYVTLGSLILIEWRVYNILMRSIALLKIFLGIAYVHTSLFSVYPQTVMFMTKSNLEFYGEFKLLVLLIIYMLLGITFLLAHRKRESETSCDTIS